MSKKKNDAEEIMLGGWGQGEPICWTKKEKTGKIIGQ